MATHIPPPPPGPVRLLDPSELADGLPSALRDAGIPEAAAGDAPALTLLCHQGDRQATLTRWGKQMGACVVVTTDQDPAWIRDLASAGVTDVLLWPDDRPHLVTRLSMAQGRQARPAPAAGSASARSLTDSDHLYRLLVETAGSVILGLRPDGTIFEWNREAERVFGFSRAAAMGRDWLELLVPAEERREDAERFARVLTGTEPRGYETRHVDAGGRVHDILWNISRLTDHAGRPTGVIAVGQDITERKWSEELLARALDRYRALLEGLPDLLFRLDASGRFLYCHAPDERPLLRPADEMIGRTIGELMPPEVAAPALAALEAALASGQMQRFEYHLTHRGGVHHWEARIIPSGPQEATAICRDLTDVRRLQAGLVVSERMASLGLLAAGIGHELNNPLTYVSANLELAIDTLKALARRAPDPLLTEALAPLFDAKSGAGRMREIVRNLRLFSQPQPDTHEPVDLADVVESALDLTMSQIRSRARLDVQLTPVPTVMGNPSALSQVLVNLLINAVQALPEDDPDGSTIRVTVGREGDAAVALSVADTGSGIPEDLLPRLFEPFVTTKAAGEGTGLGLFICHSLVTGMDGRIEVRSTPGQGSEFRVVLPSGRPTARETRPEPGPARPDAARILVVDDTPEIGVLLARMLESDHRVDVVHGAAAALDRLADGRRYDVILCDLMMPGVTGMDLHAALRRRHPDQAERMVFMTGGAFTDTARQFLAEMGHARLDKPFVQQEVVRAIASVLQAPV